MRALVGLLLVGSLVGACTSSSVSKSETANQNRLSKGEEALRTGMSIEEVKEKFPDVMNCRGSAKSYTLCNGTFMVRGERYLPLIATMDSVSISNSHYRNRKYQTLTLHFKEGKLERWEKTSETNSSRN